MKDLDLQIIQNIKFSLSHSWSKLFIVLYTVSNNKLIGCGNNNINNNNYEEKTQCFSFRNV